MRRRAADSKASISDALADSGGLYEILIPNAPRHTDVVRAASELRLPLQTTWAAATETLYLLGRDGGRPAQMRFWAFVESGSLSIETAVPEDAARCAALMRKYNFCDVADASLVALAERTGITTVLTLDSDFYIYRLQNGASLLPVPGTADGGQ